MKKMMLGIGLCAVAMVAAGCSTSTDDGAAPQAEADQAGELASFTWNGVTVTALAPEYYSVGPNPMGNYTYYVRGKFSLSATSTSGVCAVKPTSITCDPNGAKGTQGHIACRDALGAVSGHWYYCGAVEDAQYDNLPTGPICLDRPGGQQAMCAGAPANACKTSAGATCSPCNPGAGCFYQPIPAGTYYTPSIKVTNGSVQHWASYACVNGCNPEPNEPSISKDSPILYVPNSGGTNCEMCGSVCC